MSNVDECTKAIESLTLGPINSLHDEPKQEVSSYPDYDMPIQSKGGYQLDFENLDAFNPFQGSVKMVLSPLRSAVDNPPTESPNTETENIAEQPTKIESALDDTLPFAPPVDHSLVDTSSNISSAESSVVTVLKVPAMEEQDSCTATPDEKQPSLNVTQDYSSGSFVEDAPLPTKGSYSLDFDPTKIESVLDDTLPFAPPVDHSLVDTSSNISSAESSVVTVLKVPAMEEQDSCTATPDEKQPSLNVTQDYSSGSFVEDAPLPTKGSYSLDFDPTKIESALDDTLPFAPPGDHSLVDTSSNISSAESSVVTVLKVPAMEEQDSCTATPDEKQPSLNVTQDYSSGSFVEDAPLPTKGSYSLDFDPTKIESTLDDTLPFAPPVDHSLVDTSSNISSAESSVVTVLKVPAMEEQDSCTATPDEKQPPINVAQDYSSGSFVEDAPLPTKGSYSLDFDPTKIESALDDTLPFAPPGDHSLVDTSSNISSAESSVVTVLKVPAMEEQDSCTATPDEKQPSLNVTQDYSSGSFVEDAPLPTKGSYSLDFDPTKIESALDDTLPFAPPVDHSLVDTSSNISSAEISVVTVLKVPAMEEQDSCTATPDEKQPSLNVTQDYSSGSFVEAAPLPTKGSYSLDFDPTKIESALDDTLPSPNLGITPWLTPPPTSAPQRAAWSQC
ncbi:hypothetical protein JOQ06_028833 [Pogonophryne albipinna]|uniref:Uncharacterized protein n=1 Tax=Pogonophryne albipinna TaxID=1090488 RepID=A0AAD6BAS6_9TELE|nr:hypothetical protein JOQ06_028833 [Pogonophryne albipinna]